MVAINGKRQAAGRLILSFLPTPGKDFRMLGLVSS
jgi:hypothetical protein